MMNRKSLQDKAYNHILQKQYTNVESMMSLCKVYDGDPYGDSDYGLFLCGFKFVPGKK